MFCAAIALGACDQASSIEDETSLEGAHRATPALSLNKLLSSGPVVDVPAGSVNALAAAVAAVGEGGVVRLKAGVHHEDHTVEINHQVSVVGEPGAILISDTQPGLAIGVMDAALYLHNASGVIIHGLEILPKDEIGGTAIFTEQVPGAIISQNTMRRHEFGVIVHHGDRTAIKDNTIVASSGWQTGEIIEADGVIIVNGAFVEVSGNYVSNAVLGLFLSDRKGIAIDNTTMGNFIGVLLCNVPLAVPKPGGGLISSETPGTRWIIRGNQTTDNFDIGILAIDGANNNLIVNNTGGNNGRYDIELAGDSERFGFFTPTSFENKVVVGQDTDAVVKDCGVNDQVNGGVLVDTMVDPCS